MYNSSLRVTELCVNVHTQVELRTSPLFEAAVLILETNKLRKRIGLRILHTRLQLVNG